MLSETLVSDDLSPSVASGDQTTHLPSSSGKVRLPSLMKSPTSPSFKHAVSPPSHERVVTPPTMREGDLPSPVEKEKPRLPARRASVSDPSILPSPLNLTGTEEGGRIAPMSSSALRTRRKSRAGGALLPNSASAASTLRKGALSPGGSSPKKEKLPGRNRRMSVEVGPAALRLLGDDEAKVAAMISGDYEKTAEEEAIDKLSALAASREMQQAGEVDREGPLGEFVPSPSSKGGGRHRVGGGRNKSNAHGERVRIGYFRTLLYERRQTLAAKLAASRSDPEASQLKGSKTKGVFFAALQKDTIALGAIRKQLRSSSGYLGGSLSLHLENALRDFSVEMSEKFSREAFVLLLRKVAPGATQPQYYRIWNILAKKSKPKKKAVSTGLEKDRPGVTFQMLDAELSLALNRVLYETRGILFKKNGSVKEALAKQRVDPLLRVSEENFSAFLKPIVGLNAEECEVIFDCIDMLGDRYVTLKSVGLALAEVPPLQLTEEFREKITELYGSTSAGLRALGMEEDRDVPYAEFIDIMTSHGLEYEAARRIFLALDAEAQGFVDSGRIRQLVRLASPSVTLDRIRKMLIANFKKVMDAFTIIRNAEGGGGLSREEFDAGMSLLNVPQSESRMLFAVIDADGSGDVDRFELQAAMRAFAPSHALKDFVMLLRNVLHQPSDIVESFRMFGNSSEGGEGGAAGGGAETDRERERERERDREKDRDRERDRGRRGSVTEGEPALPHWVDKNLFEQWLFAIKLSDEIGQANTDIIFQLLDSKMEGKITLAHLVNTIYPDAEPVIHRKFRRASMVARVRRASMQIDKELQPLKDELRKLKMELAAGIQRVHKAAINGGVGGRRETVRVSTPPLVRASFDKQKRLHNVAERTMAETCPQVAQGDYISKALRTKVQEYFRLREKVLEAALEVKIDERPDMLEVFEDHKFHITPTFMGEN